MPELSVQLELSKSWSSSSKHICLCIAFENRQAKGDKDEKEESRVTFLKLKGKKWTHFMRLKSTMGTKLTFDPKSEAGTNIFILFHTPNQQTANLHTIKLLCGSQPQRGRSVVPVLHNAVC